MNTMKVLRIKLKQNKAHYRKADSVTNRLTYPLPPFSTVIGALHNACGYTEYHEMDISVQGKYGSMGRELYVNHCRLKRLEGDRGILIKLNNPGMLSAGYKEVASVIKSQGGSFMEEKFISVKNRDILDEYKNLKIINEELNLENREEIKPKIKLIKDKIKELRKEVRELKKDKSDKYKEVELKIKELQKEQAEVREEFESRQFPIKEELDKFAALTKSPQIYEVLYDVELVLHVRADEAVMQDIYNNINNFVSLGRSEDFIDLEEIKFVEISNNIEIDDAIESLNSTTGYVSKSAYNNGELELRRAEKRYKSDIAVKGTKYFLDKNYSIMDNKRVFNKKEVVFISEYGIALGKHENVFMDEDRYILELI